MLVHRFIPFALHPIQSAPDVAHTEGMFARRWRARRRRVLVWHIPFNFTLDVSKQAAGGLQEMCCVGGGSGSSVLVVVVVVVEQGSRS